MVKTYAAVRNVVYCFENKNGSPLTVLRGFFYTLEAPASRYPAKMLEAGRVREENPQRRWKRSRDPARRRGKIDKKRRTAGSPLQTSPKQHTSPQRKSKISSIINETDNKTHIRSYTNKF